MITALRVIDAISDWSGRIIRWLVVFLVVVVTTEVTMRYVFNRPTMWAFETSIMLGAAIYAMAWSYAQRHRAHVRVDVLYTHLSPRKKAIIDVVGYSLFFVPLIFILVDASITNAWEAWVARERMEKTFWYPPATPLRTVVALGFVLLALQGAAQLFRDFYFLVRNKPYD